MRRAALALPAVSSGPICRVSAVLMGACALGCAPPALPSDTGATAATGPSIEFIFPTSTLSSPVCSEFVVAVDIDGFNVEDPAPEEGVVDGRGHWHLDDDITGDYIVAVDPFLEVSADLDGGTERAYRITASLVNLDHTPLDQGRFPDSVATAEFTVSDSDDCVGGGGAAATP